MVADNVSLNNFVAVGIEALHQGLSGLYSPTHETGNVISTYPYYLIPVLLPPVTVKRKPCLNRGTEPTLKSKHSVTPLLPNLKLRT